MTTLRNILTCIILIMMWSCKNEAVTKEAPDFIEKDTSAVKNIRTNNETTNYEVTEDTVTNINFDGFSVSISRLVIFDEERRLQQIQADTVYIEPELAETIEGQKIKVTSGNLKNISIEQRYETSVTIMYGGPHCDLTEWKHYRSEWQALEKNSDGDFLCKEYTATEADKFPEVSIDELKTAVRKYCGEGGAEHIAKVTSPTDYPSGVGISRYYLRITGQQADTNETVVKLIIIYVAMGC